MRRASFFWPMLLFSGGLIWVSQQRPDVPHEHGLVLAYSTLLLAFYMPAFMLCFLINLAGLPFGMDHTPLEAFISRWMLPISAFVWFFPYCRVLRLFGTYDPFAARDKRRPWLLRGLVWVMDEWDKLSFGRRKSAGWAGTIRGLAAHYRKEDFFAGCLTLFGGRIATLWPVGVEAKGCAVTYGMQGSGKTAGAVMNAVALHDGGLLVIDSVGEITDRCYARRGDGDPSQGVRGLGNKTHHFDPTGLAKVPRRRDSRYNPMHEIARVKNAGQALRLIFALAEAMIKNPGAGENCWVYEDGRDFLYGLIAHVITSYSHARQTLVTVRQLLTEGDRATFAEAKAAAAAALKTGTPGPHPNIENMTAFDMLLDVMMKAPEGPFRHVIAGQAATVKQMGDRQRGSILSAVKTATIWLDMPEYRDAVTECDFYLADFAAKEQSVFICVPLDELKGIASGCVRMFVTLFTTIMYKAEVRPKKTVLFLCDEYPQLGHIQRMCVIGPTMRKYKVKLWVICQDLEQLRTTYPDEYGGFLGCASMVEAFNVHHDETVDYLVKSLGEGIVRERDPDTGRIVKRSFPLLDRQQLPVFLNDGNCVVLRYHKRPYRLRAAMYYNTLPYWMYSPDPAFPEPRLRAWMRRRAVEKAERQSIGKKEPVAAVQA